MIIIIVLYTVAYEASHAGGGGATLNLIEKLIK